MFRQCLGNICPTIQGTFFLALSAVCLASAIILGNFRFYNFCMNIFNVLLLQPNQITHFLFQF